MITDLAVILTDWNVFPLHFTPRAGVYALESGFGVASISTRALTVALLAALGT